MHIIAFPQGIGDQHKNEVGMAGSKGTQTRFVKICTNFVYVLFDPDGLVKETVRAMKLRREFDQLLLFPGKTWR